MSAPLASSGSGVSTQPVRARREKRKNLTSSNDRPETLATNAARCTWVLETDVTGEIWPPAGCEPGLETAGIAAVADVTGAALVLVRDLAACLSFVAILQVLWQEGSVEGYGHLIGFIAQIRSV